MIIKKLFIVKMKLYFVVCDELIALNSKCSHLKAPPHKEVDRFKHIKVTIKNPNTNKVDDRIYSYIAKHNKKMISIL